MAAKAIAERIGSAFAEAEALPAETLSCVPEWP